MPSSPAEQVPAPLAFLAGAGVALAAIGGCPDRTDVDPGPVVPVAQSFDAYRDLMGDVWTDAAAKVEAGELATDRAAHDFVAGRAELARKAAFQPVHDREQQALGEEKWTPAGCARLWRTFAAEAKRATPADECKQAE